MHVCVSPGARTTSVSGMMERKKKEVGLRGKTIKKNGEIYGEKRKGKNTEKVRERSRFER